jgi:DNA-directed RNA polymerase specialized sigma subunit
VYIERDGEYRILRSNGTLVKADRSVVDNILTESHVHAQYEQKLEVEATKKQLESLPPGIKELISAWIAAGKGLS